MRLKPVPEPPPDLDGVEQARRAVPLVPGSETDCCARLQRRLDLESREAARTWLTFLRAVDLVARGARGFTRTPVDVERDRLAESFVEGVFGAREVLDALDADDPRSVEAVYERFEQHVPQWERHKGTGWRRTWRGRVRRLLEWAVLLGLAERVDGRYRSR